jgi:chemotaxis protein MotB
MIMKHLVRTAIVLSLIFTSCVSKKKYRALEAQAGKFSLDVKNCNEDLLRERKLTAELESKNKSLAAEVDYLKANSSQVLGALEDMSVINTKQAESIKQSLQNISEKDNYIKNLQTAISRKDSLNLALVMNLKGSLDDVNDKDINIKVEKGVVYIDISDKLLFNSGKYTVTKDARKVLAKVAKVLNAQPDIEFMVEGHTDSIPIRTECIEDNWDLSVKRATSVVRILQKEYNIQPARMTASGHGQYIPVASNQDADGRSVNRRTRIIILPQLDQFFKLMVRK